LGYCSFFLETYSISLDLTVSSFSEILKNLKNEREKKNEMKILNRISIWNLRNYLMSFFFDGEEDCLGEDGAKVEEFS